MPSYGLPTNPSIEIISEIHKIYDLNFECVGNSDIINKRRSEIAKLLERFRQKPIAHTAVVYSIFLRQYNIICNNQNLLQ